MTLKKLDNQIKLPLYIQQLDALIWLGKSLNISRSCNGKLNNTTVITTSTLISPTTACAFQTRNCKISVDTTKQIYDGQEQIVIPAFNASNMIRNSESITTICQDSLQLLDTVDKNLKYALEFEEDLRLKLEQLQEPWYTKLYYGLIIGAATLVNKSYQR